MQGADAAAGRVDFDDLSAGFHRVRSRLVDSKGVSYYEFRKTLTPRYWRVWLELLAGYAALIALGLALLTIRHENVVRQLLTGLAAALPFGVLFSYIALFFHAASHFELHPTRTVNDWLANVFIGVLSAYPMSKYRPTHFDHHRHLGLPEDPEAAYIEALDLRLLVESLTGIRFLRILWSHVSGNRPAPARESATKTAPAAESEAASNAASKSASEPAPFNWGLPCGILLHATVVAGALWVGAVGLAVGWIAGFVFVARLVSAIRSMLEHRSESADPAIDYTRTSHGAVSRIFGDGPVAQTLGGAGFNRHLLHHWDPQVPYTRLKDLERYLRDTELRPVIETRSTTYATTFLRLFHY
jgi:fatty acid desaturase